MKRALHRRLSGATAIALCLGWLAQDRLSWDEPGDQPILELLVPAYFYPEPGDRWSALARAASEVPLTVIANPRNGPGSARDEVYARAIESVRRAGGHVVGYVYSRYGTRPLDKVTRDIDTWNRFYRVDGIFVDEMSSETSSGNLSYFSRLYQHVKANGNALRVIGNPGTHAAQAYMITPAVDTIVNFESPLINYPRFTPSEWAIRQSRSQFGHLIYLSESADAMREALRQAVGHNAGLVYVTDGVRANPWLSLPAYWEDQVACVRKINAGKDC